VPLLLETLTMDRISLILSGRVGVLGSNVCTCHVVGCLFTQYHRLKSEMRCNIDTVSSVKLTDVPKNDIVARGQVIVAGKHLELLQLSFLPTSFSNLLAIRTAQYGSELQSSQGGIRVKSCWKHNP
jgi:hypothetical protein